MKRLLLTVAALVVLNGGAAEAMLQAASKSMPSFSLSLLTTEKIVRSCFLKLKDGLLSPIYTSNGAPESRANFVEVLGEKEGNLLVKDPFHRLIDKNRKSLNRFLAHPFYQNFKKFSEEMERVVGMNQAPVHAVSSYDFRSVKRRTVKDVLFSLIVLNKSYPEIYRKIEDCYWESFDDIGLDDRSISYNPKKNRLALGFRDRDQLFYNLFHGGGYVAEHSFWKGGRGTNTFSYLLLINAIRSCSPHNAAMLRSGVRHIADPILFEFYATELVRLFMEQNTVSLSNVLHTLRINRLDPNIPSETLLRTAVAVFQEGMKIAQRGTFLANDFVTALAAWSLKREDFPQAVDFLKSAPDFTPGWGPYTIPGLCNHMTTLFNSPRAVQTQQVQSS